MAYQRNRDPVGTPLVSPVFAFDMTIQQRSACLWEVGLHMLYPGINFSLKCSPLRYCDAANRTVEITGRISLRDIAV